MPTTTLPVDHKAIQIAFREIISTLPSLPAMRAWENKDFTPVKGQPYVEEDYVPATVSLRGLTKNGLVETRGAYILKWYGLEDTGLEMADGVTGLLRLFPPGSSFTAGSGDVIRIRGDVAPSRGQLRQVVAGWATIVVTIPFRVFNLNPN